MSCYNEYATHPDRDAHKLLSDTREIYMWQSLFGFRDPPMLTDLVALAREIRVIKWDGVA